MKKKLGWDEKEKKREEERKVLHRLFKYLREFGNLMCPLFFSSADSDSPSKKCTLLLVVLGGGPLSQIAHQMMAKVAKGSF